MKTLTLLTFVIMVAISPLTAQSEIETRLTFESFGNDSMNVCMGSGMLANFSPIAYGTTAQLSGAKGIHLCVKGNLINQIQNLISGRIYTVVFRINKVNNYSKRIFGELIEIKLQ